mgnify:FL=1
MTVLPAAATLRCVSMVVSVTAVLSVDELQQEDTVSQLILPIQSAVNT